MFSSHDPHQFLGVHEGILRAFAPGASELKVELRGQMVPMQKRGEVGLFELQVGEIKPTDYRLYYMNGLLAHDPYAFWPSIGELDLHLFANGVHYQLYEMLGARRMVHQGVEGVRFAVWAPSASGVALVADFNYWDGRRHPMRSLGSSGVWELFVPGIGVGEKYKFEIRTREEHLRVKSDPFANGCELRPKTASVVSDLAQFAWSDGAWMEARKKQEERPVYIYELHLGSWKRRGTEFLDYEQLAQLLGDYCEEMGFTHVELMPVMEHPLDESWGYQVTGFFAPTSRFGTPRQFQKFIDHLHSRGIGVILDWVPAHFPTDDFSLAQFDGTALYEHVDPRQGFHPHWNTLIFNYGRKEVSNFLIASALFWLEVMHVDGLRVDAVASMLYLDYGREEGGWIPNPHGGRENLEAIEFLKHLNSIVCSRVAGAMMIAEESTAFPGVTQRVEDGGLGFQYKWNMGWMNDTLRYFEKDPIFRHYHHNELTFGLLYAFSERFMLVLSHDEVVHGKRSLLGKMPGDRWQQFANLRLCLSYQLCQPGKKLLFMGNELGEWQEWNCQEQLPWYLLQDPAHNGAQRMVKEMVHLYRKRPALWQRDSSHEGFNWVDFADRQNSVISYLRCSSSEQLLCLHNFTPNFCPDYRLHLPGVRSVRALFSSDQPEYGGSGVTGQEVKLLLDAKGCSTGIEIRLAPLATMIFEVI